MVFNPYTGAPQTPPLPVAPQTPVPPVSYRGPSGGGSEKKPRRKSLKNKGKGGSSKMASAKVAPEVTSVSRPAEVPGSMGDPPAYITPATARVLGNGGYRG